MSSARSFVPFLTALMLGFCGCGGSSNGGGDQPPSPTTTTTAPASTTVPAEPSCSTATPPNERQPSCYLTLERVLVSLGPRLEYEAQEMVNQGRNFVYVAIHCDARDAPFSVTRGELLAQASRAFLMYYGWPSEEEAASNPPNHPAYLTWRDRFRINRRCPGIEGDPWCSRTDIYKANWEPWYDGWKEVLAANRKLDSRSPIHDGIRHWAKSTGRCQ